MNKLTLQQERSYGIKSTFKALFYLKKNEPKKNGRAVIMVCTTVDGDQVQSSSKLDIHPDNWDTKTGRAVINKQSAGRKENLKISSLNRTLDEIRSAITMHYICMMNVDGYALPEKIRNAFLGLEEKEKTLISYFTQHNERYAKGIGKTTTQKTYSRHELAKQRMVELLQKEYKLSGIPVKEITITRIENFYLYLRQKCEISNNTTMKFVQRFHTVLLFAQKSGLSFIDPFGNFRFNFDKTDRGYLTQGGIDTIYYKEFRSKRLEHVRDAFIFSCYTGLPYCSIYTLSSEDIKIDVDGKKWIMKDRGKTGVESFIPLLRIPLDILAKYEGKLKGGRLLPVISNQKMNEYLAEIATICRINKRVTYRLARRSFTTEIYPTKGVPIESVPKILGHANIQTTQIYARVVDRKLNHDMNMLDRKLKNM